MFSRKIPIAKALILSSWAIPLITAAGISIAVFLKGNLLLAAGVCLVLLISVVLAALLRMCANLVQMIFEIQNILQYQYREHSGILSSLSANVQSMRKEDTAAVVREISARLLSGNVEIAENLNTLGELQKIKSDDLSELLQVLKNNTLPERVQLMREELQEIKNSCGQVACDTRDIASFFSLMEKHLNIKQQ